MFSYLFEGEHFKKKLVKASSSASVEVTLFSLQILLIALEPIEEGENTIVLLLGRDSGFCSPKLSAAAATAFLVNSGCSDFLTSSRLEVSSLRRIPR